MKRRIWRSRCRVGWWETSDFPAKPSEEADLERLFDVLRAIAYWLYTKASELEDVASAPEQLRALGCQRIEHQTQDSHTVAFRRIIDSVGSQVRLTVQIEFDVGSDYDCRFDGVFLEVSDHRMQRETYRHRLGLTSVCEVERLLELLRPGVPEDDLYFLLRPLRVLDEADLDLLSDYPASEPMWEDILALWDDFTPIWWPFEKEGHPWPSEERRLVLLSRIRAGLPSDFPKTPSTPVQLAQVANELRHIADWVSSGDADVLNDT